MEGRVLYTARDNKKYKKRVSRRAIWAWAAIFVFLGFWAGAVYLLRLPAWQIKKVEINGLVIIDFGEIKSKIDSFISGRKFFLLPLSSYPIFNSNNLALLLKENFPRLEQVWVKKIFPDSL